MKKKILSICLVAALAVTAVVGGTMAYFTDKDNATNTFTVGGVKIDLIEQQVNKDGTALEAFEQGKVLMPIVGSAQGEKDDFGQPKAKNYVDKMVTVKNTGKSAAFVRAYFAIPSALDDGFEESFNASMNILHFNFGNKVNEDGTVVTTYNNEWLWGSEAKPNHSGWNYFETTIDNVAYNVYYADYYKALPAGETTEQFVSGVYLDKSFDMSVDEDGNNVYSAFGQEVDVTGLVNDNGELVINCPVYAVAVQADGFDNAAAAFTAAFGADFNPWG